MRIAIDTNVFVAAPRSGGGASRQVPRWGRLRWPDLKILTHVIRLTVIGMAVTSSKMKALPSRLEASRLTQIMRVGCNLRWRARHDYLPARH